VLTKEVLRDSFPSGVVARREDVERVGCAEHVASRAGPIGPVSKHFVNRGGWLWTIAYDTHPSRVASLPVRRVVRGVVLSVREQEFVEAARSIGASAPRVLFRHVLPHTLGYVVVDATIAASAAILIEAALSFVGFGVVAPDTSVGRLSLPVVAAAGVDARGGTADAQSLRTPRALANSARLCTPSFRQTRST
jgi:hypothetical protein